MARPGGNPAFGKEHKFEPLYDEPLAKKQMQIRLPESQMERLEEMPTEARNKLIRGAIAAALDGGSMPLGELVSEAVRDAIISKRAAITREKKARKPDAGLIAQWEEECRRLESAL